MFPDREDVVWPLKKQFWIIALTLVSVSNVAASPAEQLLQLRARHAYNSMQELVELVPFKTLADQIEFQQFIKGHWSKEKLENTFLNSFNRTELMAYNTFLASDSGKAIFVAEQAAMTEDQSLEREVYWDQNKVSPEEKKRRLLLFDQIIELSSWNSFHWFIKSEVAQNIKRLAKDKGKRAVASVSQKERGPFAKRLKRRLQVQLFYAYRKLTYSQLKNYFKFLSSPEGKSLHLKMIQSLKSAISKQMLKLEK